MKNEEETLESRIVTALMPIIRYNMNNLKTLSLKDTSTNDQLVTEIYNGNYISSTDSTENSDYRKYIDYDNHTYLSWNFYDNKVKNPAIVQFSNSTTKEFMWAEATSRQYDPISLIFTYARLLVEKSESVNGLSFTDFVNNGNYYEIGFNIQETFTTTKHINGMFLIFNWNSSNGVTYAQCIFEDTQIKIVDGVEQDNPQTQQEVSYSTTYTYGQRDDAPESLKKEKEEALNALSSSNDKENN